jgi:16S rRNA (cytidine1402-2'-O)-methyltransferase
MRAVRAKQRAKSYLLAGQPVEAPRLAAGLHLVATPIGNLRDITLRALETLAGADLIACEDTRVTRRLLDHYGIAAPLTPYHEHNAAAARPKLLERLAAGESVALVSDAGTPLVSDPGFRLVGQAMEAGIRVVPIPGASAVLAAITASGLPSDTFLFGGFLPVKGGQLRSRLEALRATDATLIFFESPRRLAETLAAMVDTFGGDRPAVVARELTKTFEELRRATLDELAAHYREAATPKGEVVICVAPPQAQRVAAPEDVDRLLLSLAGEMPASKAAAEAARMTGRAKPELYRRLLELKDRSDD